MKSKLRDSQGITLIVVLMVMAILLSVVGAGLLFSGINTKITGNYQTGTRAFYAADIGINALASAITPGSSPSSTAVPLGNNICYRFGKRDGTVPSFQPVVKSGAGFSLAPALATTLRVIPFISIRLTLPELSVPEQVVPQLARRLPRAKLKPRPRTVPWQNRRV